MPTTTTAGRPPAARLVVRRHAARTCGGWRATPTSATGPTTAPTARPGPAPRRARRGGRPTTRLRRLRSALGPRLVRGPQRAHGDGRLAVRPQRPRRRPRHDQRRLPGAGTGAAEPAGHRRGDRRHACSSRRGRATGVRARVGGDWIERAGAGHRALRRRDPLTGDPAALGHRPRRAVARLPSARACRSIRWRCSGSSRARTRVPSSTPAPDQLLRALLVRAGGRGRERHDDRVGQPDAGAARTTPTSHARHRRAARDVGRRRRRQGRRRPRAPVPLGQPAVLARAAGARVARPRRRVRGSSSSLLDDAADLVRMRDGVKRALELLRDRRFDAAFEHIAIDMTGRGLEALVRRCARSTLADGDGRRHRHICGTCRMGAPDDPRVGGRPAGPRARRRRPVGRRRVRVPGGASARTRTCRPSQPPSGCRTSSATPPRRPTASEPRAFRCQLARELAGAPSEDQDRLDRRAARRVGEGGVDVLEVVSCGPASRAAAGPRRAARRAGG